MIANEFSGGIPCFAPTREAAELEGSKAFAKDFMQKYNIPTAEFSTFSNYQDVESYVQHFHGQRVVIKADGLAAGKGVILPENLEEAQQALHEMIMDTKFGLAGQTVVIEEYLEGEEVSILTFCDGKTFKSLPPDQDHKRALDGNQGLNTGGMGVSAPLPFLNPDQMHQIEQDIIQPTLEGLQAEGTNFGLFPVVSSC